MSDWNDPVATSTRVYGADAHDGAEILGNNAPDRPRRPWLGWVAGVALALVAIGLVADQVAAERNRDDLASLVSDGGLAVAHADGRISGMVAYASPALSSPDVDPSVRADLRDLVRDAAAQGAADVRAARAELASLRVAPWHSDLIEARDEFGDYLSDRLARLETIAGQYPGGLNRDGERALSRARAALDRAGVTAPDAVAASDG